MRRPPATHDAAIPTLNEAATLLERANAQNDLWAHSIGVATAALRLAAALVRTNACLNLHVVTAGGLLHDIGKGHPNHAQAGARMVQEAGYPAIAQVVGAHTDFTPMDHERITEAEIVFLADKLVRRDRCVVLESRFEHAAQRYAHDPEASAAVARRRDCAMRSRERLTAILGHSPESVAAVPSGHPLEAELDSVLRDHARESTESQACRPMHPSPLPS